MTRPSDFGTWRCENCGESTYGERAEPPHDHIHACDGAEPGDLVFSEK